jgi:small subunit ribosomal protein S6
MKLYELTVIINPTLDDSAIQSEIDKIEHQVTGSGGQIEKIDRWGVRRLTYKIAGQHQGHYVFFLFKSKPGLPAEIERNLRLNENIIRFLSVVSAGIAPAKPIKAIVDDEEDTQFEELTSE